MKKRKPIIVPDDIHEIAPTRSEGAKAAQELSKMHPGIPIAALAALASNYVTIMPFGEWASNNQERLYVPSFTASPFEVYESGRKVKFDGNELPKDDRILLSVRMSDVQMLISPELCERIECEDRCPPEIVALLIKGLKDGSINVWTEEVGSDA